MNNKEFSEKGAVTSVHNDRTTYHITIPGRCEVKELTNDKGETVGWILQSAEPWLRPTPLEDIGPREEREDG